MTEVPRREPLDERIARMVREQAADLGGGSGSLFAGYTRAIIDNHPTDGSAQPITWGTPTPDVVGAYGDFDGQGTTLELVEGLWLLTLNVQASGLEISGGLGAGATAEAVWSVYVSSDGANDLYSEGRVLYADLDVIRATGEFSGSDSGLVEVGAGGVTAESTFTWPAGFVASTGYGPRIAADLDAVYLGGLL